MNFPSRWKEKAQMLLVLGIVSFLGWRILSRGPGPTVRFVKFADVPLYTGSSETERLPVFEVVNHSNVELQYIIDCHVRESAGEISLPRKYLVRGEYCTGVPFRTIAPGVRQEIHGSFFGRGEEAFRVGVDLRPATASTFVSTSTKWATELRKFGNRVHYYLWPERSLFWSDWVSLPSDVRWMRSAEPFEVNERRVWPRREW